MASRLLTLSAGVGLAGPLLNAQALCHEQRAVAAQTRKVLAQYEQTILVAFKEIEDALVTVVQLYKALGDGRRDEETGTQVLGTRMIRRFGQIW